VLRQDKKFGLEVVDLAKDPFAAGPLARSTTRTSNLYMALACVSKSGHAHLDSQTQESSRSAGDSAVI
jgi:hypothetical protein